MGFRGSRVQIPPSRLSEDQAPQRLSLWGFFDVVSLVVILLRSPTDPRGPTHVLAPCGFDLNAVVVPEVAANVARPRAAAVCPCPLHLVVPPRCDDPAVQRRMRWSDETVGRGDVCEQAFHSVCSFSISSPGEEGGRSNPRHPPPPNRPGQAFNAFCGVSSTSIKWGLAVSAFGSVIVST